VTLRPAGQWPNPADSNRPRTKAELMAAIAAELERKVAGVGWDCLSQYREDLSGEFVRSDEEVVLKIRGPDLDILEKLAGQAKGRLEKVAGVSGVRILHARGLRQLTWRVDPDKCARWGVTVADVNHVLRCALEGKTISRMIEGEKIIDITLLWPPRLRRDAEAIQDIGLDVVNNQSGPLPVATAPLPNNPLDQRPRLRLRDLVSPLGEKGATGPGVAQIYREDGQRVLLLRVGVRGRAQSEVRAEGEQGIAPLLEPGYRLDWDSGR
jgi:cobalt-zinc-cadmium resistance protein CzcA